ncbi:hypothetical protein QTH89_15645 [Variovorax sp. J22G21]|uniref:hypothetical protein n=1 Tax=Variovorax fucosicus TaxID=3053517 RepID=UPI002576185F|nr:MULTISPECIES: hypothetical protein [unclassified Variovorax]MDM0037861.1 hypothetical protein [Variovorax sp. J22R193]MDM0062637.1 hypothetical protein [Variovorax sp. J22G21]
MNPLDALINTRMRSTQTRMPLAWGWLGNTLFTPGDDLAYISCMQVIRFLAFNI